MRRIINFCIAIILCGLAISNIVPGVAHHSKKTPNHSVTSSLNEPYNSKFIAGATPNKRINSSSGGSLVLRPRGNQQSSANELGTQALNGPFVSIDLTDGTLLFKRSKSAGGFTEPVTATINEFAFPIIKLKKNGQKLLLKGNPGGNSLESIFPDGGTATALIINGDGVRLYLTLVRHGASISVLPPSIAGSVSEQRTPLSPLSISGANFSPEPSDNIVIFKTADAQEYRLPALGTDGNSLTTMIPLIPKNGSNSFYSGAVTVSVETASGYISNSTQLIIDPLPANPMSTGTLSRIFIQELEALSSQTEDLVTGRLIQQGLDEDTIKFLRELPHTMADNYRTMITDALEGRPHTYRADSLNGIGTETIIVDKNSIDLAERIMHSSGIIDNLATRTTSLSRELRTSLANPCPSVGWEQEIISISRSYEVYKNEGNRLFYASLAAGFIPGGGTVISKLIDFNALGLFLAQAELGSIAIKLRNIEVSPSTQTIPIGNYSPLGVRRITGYFHSPNVGDTLSKALAGILSAVIDAFFNKFKVTNSDLKVKIIEFSLDYIAQAFGAELDRRIDQRLEPLPLSSQTTFIQFLANDNNRPIAILPGWCEGTLETRGLRETGRNGEDFLVKTNAFPLYDNNGSRSQRATVIVSNDASTSSTPIVNDINPESAIAGIFDVTLNGINFNPATVEVIVSGPGCPEGGCVVPNANLKVKSATRVTAPLQIDQPNNFLIGVRNGRNGVLSNPKQLEVTRANQLPVAGFTMRAGDQTAREGQTLELVIPPQGAVDVTFSAASRSYDPDGGQLRYDWRVSTVPKSTSREFTFGLGPGNHTISLTVTDDEGTSRTATGIVAVTTQLPSQPLISDISPRQATTGSFPLTISGNNFNTENVEVVINGPGCAGSQCLIPNSVLMKTSTQIIAPVTINNPGSFNITARNGIGGPPSNQKTLTITGTAIQPIITLNPTNLSFNLQQGSLGDTRVLNISNGGTGTLNWAATATTNSGGPWLSLSFSNGTAPSSTTVVVNPAGLSPGTYSGQITVTASGATNSPQTIPVTMNVSGELPPNTPVITGITTSPNPPINGQPFTITLTGSNFSGSNSTIFFSGPGCSTPCSINASGSSTQISGQAILAAGTFSMTVRNNTTGLISNAVSLIVSPSVAAPVINQISTSPNPPITGQAFTITLTGSNFDPSNSTVFFSGPGCSTPCSISASGSSTQVSGQAILAAGTFSVTLRNNTTGLTSNAVSLTVSTAPTAPIISQISTNPSPPITGQAFTITLTGSNFAPSSSTIFFSGPGCSTPCSINASGSSTQVSGQAILAAGTFSVTVRNNTTGLTSNAVSLTVSTAAAAPVINQISTSPNPPITGQAFTITLTGTNFDPSNSTVFFSGPGCSTPCNINASGTSTQVSGQAILAAGTFSITLRNNSTGLTSNAVSLTVSSAPTAPVINQISTSPNPPITGQAFTITLTGSNFAPSNSTIFFSGPGCSTPCSINATGSSTQVSGQAILAAGTFSVTVRNNTTGLTSNAVSLTVSSAPVAPVINQISTSPNPPITGQAFTITLTGTNFDPSNSTVFFSGPGCSTPCSINASGSSTQVSGQAILAAGTFSVTLRNNTTGLTSNAVSLTVASAPVAPVINQISTSPNPPITGQAFTITLTGSNFDPSNSTVFFSGPGCSTPCSISASGSSTQVSGQAILAAGTFSVTLRNNATGLTSNAVQLTVSGATAPVINQINLSPNPPISGQAFTITLIGSNFDPSNSTVFFSGPGCTPPCSITATGSSTQVSGQAILAAGTFTVTLRNNTTGLTSNPVQITISTAPTPPVINQISTSPNPPINGQAFTITLTGTNFDPSNSTIFFSGPGCNPSCSISASGSSTQVSGQAILAAGTFNVTVRNNTTGLTSNAVSLTVSNAPNPPVINQISTSPSPPITGQAFTITLTGSNFSGSSSTIFFSGPGCSTPCSINATGTSTQVSGQAILAAGTFSVTVRNNTTGLTSNAVSLTVANAPNPPVINQINTSPNPPITGQVFTITLIGSNFDGTNSTVFFNGPGCGPCSINASGSSTQVSGQAILAAGTFNVTVRNNTTGLTSNAVSLTVSLGTPSISGMSTSPSPPIHGQPFNFTITGTNFNTSNAEVFFRGPGCPTDTSCVVTGLTGSTTQLNGAAVLATGSFTVRVRNGSGGTPSNSWSFNVN